MKKNNIFAQIKEALNILVNMGYPHLEKDVIDIDEANKVLASCVLIPPTPTISDNLYSYESQQSIFEKEERFKEWKKLLNEIPYLWICDEWGDNEIDVDKVFVAYYPKNLEDIRKLEDGDSYVPEGYITLETGGTALSSEGDGAWEEVYIKVRDFMKDLSKKSIIPVTP